MDTTQRPNQGSTTGQRTFFEQPVSLTVTLDVAAGAFHFEWAGGDTAELVASGDLTATKSDYFRWHVLDWVLDIQGQFRRDGCNSWPASSRALTKRIQKIFPISPGGFRLGLLTDSELGAAQAGRWFPLSLPAQADPWRWLELQIRAFAQLVAAHSARRTDPETMGRLCLHLVVCALLGVAPSPPPNAPTRRASVLADLTVTFDQVKEVAELVWAAPDSKRAIATGRVRCIALNEMSWELEREGNQPVRTVSPIDLESIRSNLQTWLRELPCDRQTVAGRWIRPQPRSAEPRISSEPPFGPSENPYNWLETNLVAMAQALSHRFTPRGIMADEMSPSWEAETERYRQRELRRQQKQEEEQARRKLILERQKEQRHRRELREAEARQAALRSQPSGAANKSPLPISGAGAPSKERLPLPVLPVQFELPPLQFQETAFSLPDLRTFFLRERASLWWVSNQSDDLLCLPHCRIERLEYQLRTALRVLGPLRGRALLSDEVGLGKTIEAGLVIKELLTRGMVKRFLVLTVPSLVDQWEEELSDKFGLPTATTNHAAARAGVERFWRENTGVIASLHTLKQPAQLAVAREVHWDVLVVDEAHYLRNRESQAWQAVNALPRQFLLLLTATPVQNSLEELYNLVTLLQPGQLPTPKEFRARFLDPKRPRQPREPDELRRLLGQVMIRNTRANAGLKLPPRRAETVMFEADESERAFWTLWDTQLREHLGRLNTSQSSLWGRLLLQTAGSSPAAWRAALEKFPDSAAASGWREQAPLQSSWLRKCQLLPPLTRSEGGAVIFTQFLETQAAVADFLRNTGVETFLINGSTPAVQRQPITEEFHKRGGALLLTHSGTEGRNLQFCHQLVNFDLPWNPMEIEQRIGRLHRLGQQHPVRIYNFVQSGTLQEHLLELLQEKLNLFELVVGETGLVLGERFSSEEFAEEIFRRWHQNEGQVAEAMAKLGEEIAAARDAYSEVKQLDETLFAKDYESV